MDLRKRYKDLVLEKHNVKLGFMGAFIKASCVALNAVPEVNASIEGNEIVYREYVDVSVAVATPKGLVTPVLRNVESMDIVQIEKALAELGKKVMYIYIYCILHFLLLEFIICKDIMIVWIIYLFLALIFLILT